VADLLTHLDRSGLEKKDGLLSAPLAAEAAAGAPPTEGLMSTTLHRWYRAGVLGAAILCSVGAFAQTVEKPQYGGTLEISTIFATLSALSWDHKDWPWKINHDAGGIYEQLLTADLSKGTRAGGKHAFHADAWIPTDALKGELAESWEVQKDPPAVIIKLKQGIMFPAKPGVMEAREFTADDVVFSFYYRHNSPRRPPGIGDEIDKVEALDRYTVAYRMKKYIADWPFWIGYGYNASIMPKEVASAGPADWKNLTGTGPFTLSEYIPGNQHTYSKRADYWGKEKIGEAEFKLPFVDKVVYRLIRDVSTRMTAFRTGKLDIVEAVGWENMDSLRKSNPEIKSKQWTSFYGTMMVLRTDQKPFDDIRVRRALNMAINKQEMIKSFYNDNAELLAYPMHPAYEGYYEGLSAMPEQVKELFTYNPEKAKKLLAEAGYPNGFTFKVQVSASNSGHVDLLPLVGAYLEQVGVKIEIQPMEYTTFLSVMNTKTHAPGYFMNIGHSNPLVAIRKNFITGQQWNPSMWADLAFDKKLDAAEQEADEDKRKAMVREMTREILDKAPHIWLPTAKAYTAWWPWVKNYDGEHTAGAVRPWPIYSRIWIDQDMKKKMGY
jgi:peptide/nickel transport system substrate-binding protein